MASRVDNLKLRKMLRSGKTYQECADHFGVSKSRIAQIVSENKLKISTALIRDKKLSRELIRQDIDVMKQLAQVNQYSLYLLDLFARAIEGDEEALSHLDNLGVRDKVETLLKAQRDVVNQLEAYMNMHKVMFDVQQTIDFRNTVIEAIKRNCDKVTIREIIKDLRGLKQLENAFKE